MIPALISQGFGLLCHTEASYSATDGDSGGPVWLVEDFGQPWGDRNLFAGTHSVGLSNGNKLL
jgi:hypothetical protein